MMLWKKKLHEIIKDFGLGKYEVYPIIGAKIFYDF